MSSLRKLVECMHDKKDPLTQKEKVGHSHKGMFPKVQKVYFHFSIFCISIVINIFRYISNILRLPNSSPNILGLS